MPHTAQHWLEKIHALPLTAPIKIMNVCGGHERTITMTGLRSALPAHIELIPGPGCPVCICPEEDIYQAIQLALHANITLLAFGDMLRVPVNTHKKDPRTLEQAKAAGADIRPIASPLEALHLAHQHPQRRIVFFAAGFETTTAPIAALLAQGIPTNLFILLSGRLTYPAVKLLLNSEKAGFDALIAPGHVATVMGAQEWAFVVTEHQLPAAIAGFTPESVLPALYSVLRQHLSGKQFLDNCYTTSVRPQGNPSARTDLANTMNIVDATWRGIGTIPQSGFQLHEKYRQHDAHHAFPQYTDAARKRAGEMPAGCDCARVVLGKIYPNQCRLYGTACTPRQPIGPCMVSDEGACRIWWAGGIRHSQAA